MSQNHAVVMIGATGAVGSETAKALHASQRLKRLTLLGRRPLSELTGGQLEQATIDVFDPTSYAERLEGHDVAVCTLGVGQPSKMSKEEFLRIDQRAVLDFATACKEAGVQHFELLASVGTSEQSASFYLRAKGELVRDLRALGFARLSVFQPSMILTPTNRYGISQGITLVVWPWLSKLLFGSLRKYRGVEVTTLGRAMANNVFTEGSGVEVLEWDHFQVLAAAQNEA